jgi:hypothetical protein
VDVKNAGDRAAKETVQLNLHEADVLVSIPVEQLRGFPRGGAGLGQGFRGRRPSTYLLFR